MINTMNSKFRDERGFTLVELMISVALGLLLISGLVTAFVGAQRTSKLNTALTEMQETGRFALNSMISEVRMAGFQGCANTHHSPVSIRAESAPTDNLSTSAFQAFNIDSTGTWSPLPHSSFIIHPTVGAPVPGTHAFSVQFGSPTTYLFEKMADTLSPVVITNGSSDLVTGDLAIISDCSGADLFEITASSGNILEHGATKNGDDRLSAPYGQGSEHNHARIMRFHANTYFVGYTNRFDANNKPVRALYRQTFPFENNSPVELAEGVENLRIRLGVEDPLNPGDITVVTPGHDLLDTHLVRSVQLGFLMSSYDSITEASDTRTYKIAGYDISASSGDATDGATHSNDKKMRLPFNSTVALRNR